MRKAFLIDINEVEKYYHITEDGMVFSKIKNRWLKPQKNMTGYYHYCLSFGVPEPPMWIFAHTLVALKYIGRPTEEKNEIDHIDRSILNNHYSNLRWVSHSENILKSYTDGRDHYWRGKLKPSPDIETRILMSNAKKKPVKYSFGGHEVVYDSIDDACAGLGTYRKRVYLCIKNGGEFKGGVLSFVEDHFS